MPGDKRDCHFRLQGGWERSSNKIFWYWHTHKKTCSLIGESRRRTDEYQFEKETKEVYQRKEDLQQMLNLYIIWLSAETSCQNT